MYYPSLFSEGKMVTRLQIGGGWSSGNREMFLSAGGGWSSGKREMSFQIGGGCFQIGGGWFPRFQIGGPPPKGIAVLSNMLNLFNIIHWFLKQKGDVHILHELQEDWIYCVLSVIVLRKENGILFSNRRRMVTYLQKRGDVHLLPKGKAAFWSRSNPLRIIHYFPTGRCSRPFQIEGGGSPALQESKDMYFSQTHRSTIKQIETIMYYLLLFS